MFCFPSILFFFIPLVIQGSGLDCMVSHNLMKALACYCILIGELLDAGVNRSPSAYLNNPAEERNKYMYDVDKEMTLLKFVDDEWGPVGSFNWFTTHGTSMSRTNSLISGDNKGAAARFMEDWFEKKGVGNSYSNESVADGIPRRVSNIIPHLPSNRKLLILHFYQETAIQVRIYALESSVSNRVENIRIVTCDKS